jgi:hypothetical protein
MKRTYARKGFSIGLFDIFNDLRGVVANEMRMNGRENCIEENTISTLFVLIQNTS